MEQLLGGFVRKTRAGRWSLSLAVCNSEARYMPLSGGEQVGEHVRTAPYYLLNPLRSAKPPKLLQRYYKVKLLKTPIYSIW